MDYDFFDSLTPEQAQAYLNRFVEVERQALKELQADAAKGKICLDYSLSSLPSVLKWMVKQVRMIRTPVPEDLPQWIRQAHRKGLAEFDDDSKTIVLRAAYYLGECFARLPGMRWSTGNVEYLEKNMPVIAGFSHDQELPPLIVARNQFARIVRGGKPDSEIDSMIEVWKGFLK